MKTKALQLVALGGNVSTTDQTLEETLAQAVFALAQSGFSIRAVSRFFRTPCFPVGAGPDYVNAAVMLQSSLSGQEILTRLHAIEAEFGRERVQRWGRRTLDLDLIACDEQVLPNKEVFDHWFALDPILQAKAVPDQLILPHPRVQDRAFVLVPLADIAPDWHHPVLGKSIRELLTSLPDADVKDVTPL